MFNQFDVATYGPLLLAVAIPYLALTVLGPKSPIGRVIASATCIGCSFRYLWWRWALSMPVGQTTVQEMWAWLFLICETASLGGSMMMYVFMSRRRNRSAEVDARAGSALIRRPVDVFIVTYNEPIEILERTLVGATGIDHPDLRVWLLDDGARPWVSKLAEEFGASYVSRVKGKGAKAGNVNNGLRHALATGRRPEFILLLDADFVASGHILRRTLPLFEEADVGIVQTPQHFYNPDPVQANLLCASAWPDEQRFFFSYLLEAKDAWGCAYCCGTSAVFRVEALERCGGMATETVTEDLLTTFRMREHGYRTVFLNERLSFGLAAESLQDYIAQRSRWCLGTMQQIYTRWGFAGPAKVGLVNRISSFDGTLYWISSFTFKILIAAAPCVYWWTGTAVMDSTVDNMLFWLGPYLASGMVFTTLVTRNTAFPVMTDVTQLLCSFNIVRTVATTLVKPWGHPFKVTPKGISTTGITVHWSLLAPFAAIAICNALGMLVNTSSYSQLNGTPGYAINVFWSLFNVTVLCIACAVCVELPKRRCDERFASGEPATIEFASHQPEVACVVLDFSLGGARLARDGGWAEVPPCGSLVVDGGALHLPFAVTRVTAAGELSIRFDLNASVRRALIRKLFTGRYNNEVETVRPLRTIASALARVFS